VSAVDTAIFTRRYYGHCMSCGFCADACCQHGVDVSVVERDRILAQSAALVPRVGSDPSTWFELETEEDGDFPGGAVTRTTVVNGRCVFLRRGERGCSLHALALETNADYHLLKPMVSALFPVTFGDGALLCSDELIEGSLVCAGDGPTAYEMARSELLYYFGDELVGELDALSRDVQTQTAQR
jgi:hypothetical protein